MSETVTSSLLNCARKIRFFKRSLLFKRIENEDSINIYMMLRRNIMIGWIGKWLLSAIILSLITGCSPKVPQSITPTPAKQIITPKVDEQESIIALTNGLLIDGTGNEPIHDAVMLIQGDRILEAGAQEDVTIPSGTQVFDVNGGAILPGFINAHVHKAYDKDRLQAWAQGGVTTVRDEAVIGDQTLIEALAIREQVTGDAQYARLISAGEMISALDGYGSLYVASAEEARQKVDYELNLGVDLIKIAMEDGYDGTSDLPNLTSEALNGIVQTAHEQGKLVSGHITRARYMEILVEAGVDDIAHLPCDLASVSVYKKMVEKGIYVTPTFSVYRNYDAPVNIVVENLRRFNRLGGKIALGSDYAGGPGEFELGIPMYEIEKMAEAGMTPMQIIVASTLNAAVVCGMEREIGTLQPGKIADVLVLDGNPLEDIQALTHIKMVIHLGEVIRDGDA